MSTLYYAIIPSEVGPLTLRWQGDALVGLHFANDTSRATKDLASRAGVVRDDARLEPVRRQLEEYFAGDRNTFDVPLAFEGTPFQERVWRALLEIPYGETSTYGELARHIGVPLGAARAVGAANGRNPIAVIVPCHRVIGKDRSLTGFAGGLGRKRWLLRHEGSSYLELENEGTTQLALL